ncbi:hypothetical protein MLD38_017273 [Melastoma candidum]|uniref:Uncharacterized protein n=1 Tax=Melastoma candidum TaxID=119954 RepID=A0ACB9QQ42_9MYRT|nr:hypothetical protein MLD38_017273 [Melastoma candidum]
MISSLALAALNGERAVSCSSSPESSLSLPLSLLPYGISLCVLAVAALSVEIRVDGCPSVVPFRTRPGASSGILLGAATLPAVLLAKLIQLWRGSLLDQFSSEEIDYLKMLYWTASASCIGVLLFLTICMQRSSSQSSTDAHAHQNAKIITICITVYGALCFVSLMTISQLGLEHAFNIFLVAFHGLAAVILIQHALKTFPSCASIGEALLVTAGLVLYSGDMLACALVKVNEKFILSDSISSWFGNKRSERSVVIQGLLLGLLVFSSCFQVSASNPGSCYESGLRDSGTK